MSRHVRFAAFELLSDKRLLLRDGAPLPLTPKAFDTLLFLLDHRDRVVTKDELLSSLWPDTVVEEATLTQHIYKIRKALNDEEGLRYIQTVPRRGYRFVADVSEAAADVAVAPPGEKAAWATRIGARWWIAAMAAIAVATFPMWGRRQSPRIESSTIQFTIAAPQDTRVSQVAISRDGRSVVVEAVDPNGSSRLWLRRIESLTAQPIPGTDGGYQPFWSPDGRAIGFFADGKLRTIGVDGAGGEALGDVTDARGGTWNADGDIVFAPSSRGGLFRVSARGGRPQPVTRFDAGPAMNSQRWPSFLPDGRHFLFMQMAARGDSRGVFAGDLSGAPAVRLLPDNSSAVYAKDGYLLFGRDNALVAQPFDAARLRVSGQAALVADGVGRFVSMYMPVSVSDNGLLVYAARDRRSRLVWYDRNGRATSTLGGPVRQGDPVVAADGSEVLSWRGNEGDANLWLDDVRRGTSARLTFTGQDVLPVWSPDGSEMIFRSNRGGVGDLYRKPVRRTDPETLLLASAGRKDPTDWSPDGRYLLYDDYGDRGAHSASDIFVLPLVGAPAPVRYAASPFGKWGGRFSPDGRWVAYSADDSGRPEIYVQAFPSTTERWRVSTTGGEEPQWSRDGRELYFISPDDWLNAAPVAWLNAAPVARRGSSLELGGAKRLFRIAAKFTTLRNRYAVGADGSRFLVDTPISEDALVPLTVIVNWRNVLRDRD